MSLLRSRLQKHVGRRFDKVRGLISKVDISESRESSVQCWEAGPGTLRRPRRYMYLFEFHHRPTGPPRLGKEPTRLLNQGFVRRGSGGATETLVTPTLHLDVIGCFENPASPNGKKASAAETQDRAVGRLCVTSTRTWLSGVQVYVEAEVEE